MNQSITGFHKDFENHWVAELECGHAQHVRHDPPWKERPWVTTEEGRAQYIGKSLNCVRCDEMGLKLAEAVVAACRKTLVASYEAGGTSGLCAEGRWELALDALKSMDLGKVVESALAPESR